MSSEISDLKFQLSVRETVILKMYMHGSQI